MRTKSSHPPFDPTAPNPIPKINIDDAARRLLDDLGWNAPPPDGVPTGREIVEDYLRPPLSCLPSIAANLKLGTAVTAISRQGFDKASSSGRKDAPFVVRYDDAEGEHEVLARAVIDASGTWTHPNPMGINGLPVTVERTSSRISYGIPDVAGIRRSDFVGKRTLVVGSGHSAINVALALLELRRVILLLRFFWALRHHGVARLLGGGLND
ncbi:hypothetical protein [Ensifer sp. Root127]|uniref:hypothetical protein n=1 Tax=Ensifer sp. Root127 TaxID=1736440 RepID=UPI00070B885F|nr:hypothetical protein [Ensifer sp. Root127]KQW77849.1 hypothetical protein ASD03_26795 [Ensifer sp. Root127]